MLVYMNLFVRYHPRFSLYKHLAVSSGKFITTPGEKNQLCLLLEKKSAISKGGNLTRAFNWQRFIANLHLSQFFSGARPGFALLVPFLPECGRVLRARGFHLP